MMFKYRNENSSNYIEEVFDGKYDGESWRPVNHREQQIMENLFDQPVAYMESLYTEDLDEYLFWLGMEDMEIY